MEREVKAKVIRKVVSPSFLCDILRISIDAYLFVFLPKDNMTNPLVRVMLDNGKNVTTNLLVTIKMTQH